MVMSVNSHNRTINIKRSELLEALQKNLELHTEQYKEACADYEVYVLKSLQNLVKKAKKGVLNRADNEQFRFTPSPPVSHESDYREAIEMLEYSVEDTITIDGESFKAFVKNEWKWSSAFEISSALYKTLSV